MLKRLYLLSCLLLFSCNFETPTEFTKEALQDVLYNVNNSETTFKNIIDQNKGKKIFINFWASWCADCVKGLPNVKNLQKKYPNVVFLFLSVDTKFALWKKGIKKYKIKGQHYNLPKGMNNGELVNFVNLNWIPRYMVIDETGKIALFKATKATDKDITEVLNK